MHCGQIDRCGIFNLKCHLHNWGCPLEMMGKERAQVVHSFLDIFVQYYYLFKCQPVSSWGHLSLFSHLSTDCCFILEFETKESLLHSAGLFNFFFMNCLKEMANRKCKHFMLHLYFVFVLRNAQQLFHFTFQQILISKVNLWLGFRLTYPMLTDHSGMNTEYYVVTIIVFVMNIFFPPNS